MSLFSSYLVLQHTTHVYTYSFTTHLVLLVHYSPTHVFSYTFYGQHFDRDQECIFAHVKMSFTTFILQSLNLLNPSIFQDFGATLLSRLLIHGYFPSLKMLVCLRGHFPHKPHRKFPLAEMIQTLTHDPLHATTCLQNKKRESKFLIVYLFHSLLSKR